MKEKRTNIKDVAKMAKISATTVSAYLNKTAPVNVNTAKRIEMAINELGYIPNRAAKSLRTGRSKVIALIGLYLRNPLTGEFMYRVQEKLAESNYFLDIISLNKKIVPVSDLVKVYDFNHFDGIIIGMIDKDMINYFNESNTNYVTVADYGELTSDFVKVQVDTYAAGNLAAEYLIENNHKKIGLFLNSGLPFVKDFEICKNGFSDRLKMSNLNIEFEFKTPIDIDAIRNSLENNKDQIIENIKKKKITAIFATTDMVAVYLLKLLNNCGLNVPEDISLISFDNIRYSEIVKPALTTINKPVDDIGHICVEKLISMIEKKEAPDKKVVLEPELVIRESVRKI